MNNSIKSNLEVINKNINEACEISARDSNEIKLVAVSKTKPASAIIEASKNGQILFGENQIKEAVRKNEDINNANIEWHLIGSLQTNKVKYLSKFCSLFHGLDRFELADAIQKRMEFEEQTMNCLVQVNVSKESSKSGFYLDEIKTKISEFEKYDRINIKGLMAIAENTNDRDKVRDNFRYMKDLFEDLKSRKLAENISIEELSMGMSNDYKIAIGEGSSIIRVGSAIFGNR